LEANLYFIRAKLSNPRDSELRFLQSALEAYSRSGLQFRSERANLMGDN
jgi:hypothetical protein